MDTPKKPAKGYETRERYDRPITSGSQMKAVYMNSNSIIRQDMSVRKFIPCVTISETQRYSVDRNPENPQQAEPIDCSAIIERIRQKARENQILKREYEEQARRNCQAEERRNRAVEELMKVDKYLEERTRLFLKSTANHKYAICELTTVKGNHDTQILRLSGDIVAKDNQIVKLEKQIAQEEEKLKPLIEEIRELERVQLIEEEQLMDKAEIRRVWEKKYVEKQKEFKIHSLEVSILKMQLNPYLRVGFTSFASPEDRKKMLEKGVITWNKKNTKDLTTEEIRYFIIIQLYPQWKRILNRISYHFSGYRQIFCLEDLDEKDYSPSLIEFITPSKHVRKSMSSVRSLVVVYSHQESTAESVLRSLTDLKGVSNGILSIWNVQVGPSAAENVLEVTINYRFINDERVKKFEFVRLTELSREAVSKLTPRGGDKVALMKLEIPFIFSSQAELARYQEVFEAIRRAK